MTAAIVIARGGSIRLPRKNVRPFCGLPLVAWSLIAAKCARLVDWVFLSTDDDEIEAIGREYGAEIIRRPDWPDADQVSANRVEAHACDEIANLGYDMPRFVGLFPTSPLRKPDDIDRVIERSNVTGQHKVALMHRRRETELFKDIAGLVGKMVLFDKEQKYFDMNGGAAVITNTAWYKYQQERIKAAFGDHDLAIEEVLKVPFDYPVQESGFVECEQWQCTEVDTLPEFELAEVLMEHYLLKGRGPEIYYEYAAALYESAGNWRQQ